MDIDINEARRILRAAGFVKPTSGVNSRMACAWSLSILRSVSRSLDELCPGYVEPRKAFSATLRALRAVRTYSSDGDRGALDSTLCRVAREGEAERIAAYAALQCSFDLMESAAAAGHSKRDLSVALQNAIGLLGLADPDAE